MHGQTGYLLDTEFDEIYTGLNYSGFNFINIGWSQQKKNVVQSLELELIGYSINNEKALTNSFTNGSKRTRRSGEIIYNHLFLLSDNVNGFAIGPSASIILNSNLVTPYTSAQFPRKTVDSKLGLGVCTSYYWGINDKLSLGVSSRLTLIDVGIQKNSVQNPILLPSQQGRAAFHFDLLREQYHFRLGLRFKL